MTEGGILSLSVEELYFHSQGEKLLTTSINQGGGGPLKTLNLKNLGNEKTHESKGNANSCFNFLLSWSSSYF